MVTFDLCVCVFSILGILLFFRFYRLHCHMDGIWTKGITTLVSYVVCLNSNVDRAHLASADESDKKCISQNESDRAYYKVFFFPSTSTS